jgi:tetratricopeptide (TPR) repeat protein
MERARSRVLNDFPYPVAYPYSLIFDARNTPSNRRWALCFTEYQLLRMVCLPLVSQYLQEGVDERAGGSISSINSAIAAIRSPFFSDWITLTHTLRRHLPKVGIEPLFPGLGEALEAVKQAGEHPIGMRGDTCLDPLNAILALRNETAHGGLPDEAEAMQHLEHYLPVLHQALDACDFLGDTVFNVCGDALHRVVAGRARVRTLRGVQVSEAVELALSNELVSAFEESRAVMISPRGKAVPLYPLLNSITEQEPLFLYDGHYGIRVQTQQRVEERSYIYYLGTHYRATDSVACERLKELLGKRQISFFLEKEKTAPWTIADSAADYSRRTLEELRGIKYFPECYLPYVDLERQFETFLQVPESKTWRRDTERRHYVNGFVLTGLAGTGKTAFLARQVERLLAQTGDDAGRESPNLVLFLRGNGIALRTEGMSLFRDVAEKLGLLVEGTSMKARSGGGFSSFRELLDHLHIRWKQDRVLGRRLILVLDALNEGPYAEMVIREALAMVGVAACYPWCKVIFSIRQEWLGLWSAKMTAQETSPLEELRPFLYSLHRHGPGARADGRRGAEGPPVVTMAPLTEAEAREVYERYQAAARGTGDGGIPYGIPACRTSWGELSGNTRGLLTNPLYLHLFMVTFDRKPAESVTTAPALFRRYVDTALDERPGLQACVDSVIDYLLVDLTRPGADLTDDDYHAIRRAWTEARSAEEARLTLDPIQGLAHEGMITKRVREEGSGYRFVFQAVVEYLIYWYLSRDRSESEDELAYWTRRATSPQVFPEYSGAFGFLLREWAGRSCLSHVGPLLERGAKWLGDVLSSFLIDQALAGGATAKPASLVERAAGALAQAGGTAVAASLHQTGTQLVNTPYHSAATAYLQASVAIHDRLQIATSGSPQVIDLAYSLSYLGAAWSIEGDFTRAEAAYRRVIELWRGLLTREPENHNLMRGLARTLTNYGISLDYANRAREAVRCLYEAYQLFSAIGQHEEIATTLINLGKVLISLGDVEKAEQAFYQAGKVYERQDDNAKDNESWQSEYALVLCNWANIRLFHGDVERAQSFYRKSGHIYEQLRKDYAAKLEYDEKYCMVLGNLALCLQEAGNLADAALYARGAVSMLASLWRSEPRIFAIGETYMFTVFVLGNVCVSSGLRQDAEDHYRKAEQIAAELSAWLAENGLPTAVQQAHRADSLISLADLLSHDGARRNEALALGQQALEIYTTLNNVESIPPLWLGNVSEMFGALGEIFEKCGRLAEAEWFYQEALESGALFRKQLPTHRPAEIVLAQAWARYGRALTTFPPPEELSGLPKVIPTAWYNWSRKRLRRHRGCWFLRRSLRVFHKLKQDMASHVRIKYGEASCLVALGRLREAELLLAELRQLMPEDPRVVELMRDLTSTPSAQ